MPNKYGIQKDFPATDFAGNRRDLSRFAQNVDKFIEDVLRDYRPRGTIADTAQPLTSLQSVNWWDELRCRTPTGVTVRIQFPRADAGNSGKAFALIRQDSTGTLLAQTVSTTDSPCLINGSTVYGCPTLGRYEFTFDGANYWGRP